MLNRHFFYSSQECINQTLALDVACHISCEFCNLHIWKGEGEVSWLHFTSSPLGATKYHVQLFCYRFAVCFVSLMSHTLITSI